MNTTEQTKQTELKVGKIIKITKSSNPMLWYSKYIGDEFEVLRFEMSKCIGLTAWVLEPHPYLRFINWVAYGDYEVVEKEEVVGTDGKQD